MAAGICALCENASVTTLPIHLSIDCATSSYASLRSQLPFCQDCLDCLGERSATGRDVSRRALIAASNRLEGAARRIVTGW